MVTARVGAEAVRLKQDEATWQRSTTEADNFIMECAALQRQRAATVVVKKRGLQFLGCSANYNTKVVMM